MQANDSDSVRGALSAALADAMTRRDRVAMAAYRTALSAIANAESVPLDAVQRSSAIELLPHGLGRTERPRRLLRRDDEMEIVRREANELRATADSLAASNPHAALRLREDARRLEALLDGLAGDH